MYKIGPQEKIPIIFLARYETRKERGGKKGTKYKQTSKKTLANDVSSLQKITAYSVNR